MSPPLHLLSVADLGADGIEEVLRVSDSFVEVSERAMPKVPALRGKTVVSLFFEESTRTRLSFEAAAKRLSADTMNFSVSTSSVSKGESLRDTVQTIDAMGVDALVVRHSSAGVPWQVASWVDCSVINAGDGWHEHPTQALLDCFTIQKELGSLSGLRIAVVGDVKHSRVARSNVLAFTMLGAEVTLVAPPTLLPPSLDGWPVAVSTDLDAVLPKADVVYLLRIQAERQTRGPPALAAGVHRPLRPHPRPGPAAVRRRPRHAPRPHEPRGRDRGRAGRPAPVHRHPPGRQRRGGAHGGAVPAARGHPEVTLRSCWCALRPARFVRGRGVSRG